jgi:hypothetical protein
VLEEITEVLNGNLARVENLVSLYGPATVGRRKVQDTDVLRGAVVLLHAGMEDYIRSLMIWKIDTFSAEVLSGYGFANGTKRPPTKLTLGDLSAYRGKTIDELIAESVRSHLDEFQSFNDLGEVKRALKQCGIVAAEVDAVDFAHLPELIVRRHNIVHKADRNDVAGGQGNHKTKSLSKVTVEGYVTAVKVLRDFVKQKLDVGEQ